MECPGTTTQAPHPGAPTASSPVQVPLERLGEQEVAAEARDRHIQRQHALRAGQAANQGG